MLEAMNETMREMSASSEMPMSQGTTEDAFFAEWYGPWSGLHSSRALFWRWFIFWATLFSIALGIPANIMVFIAVWSFKELQKLSHAFIVNLAVCDFIVMFMNSFVFVGLFKGQGWWDERSWFCELSGTVCIISCFGSLWNMFMIALNRLVFVKSQQLYKKVFGKTGTILAVILVWFFVYLIDLPNAVYVGLAQHRYNPSALHCDFAFDSWWYNTFFYTGFAFLFPMAGVITCYLIILQVASKGMKTVSEKRAKEQKQLVQSLMLLLFTFFVTWGPLSALYGVEYNLKAPFEVHMILEIWAHFNSAINPIIYGFTHTGFRRAYRTLLSKFLPCIDPPEDHPGHTSHSHGHTTQTQTKARSVEKSVSYETKAEAPM